MLKRAIKRINLLCYLKRTNGYRLQDNTINGFTMVETTLTSSRKDAKSLTTRDLSELADFYTQFLRKLKLKEYIKYRKEFIYFFEKVQARIPPGKKISKLDILIPMIIFVFLRMKLAPITPVKYVDSNIMSKADLSNNLRDCLPYVPEYQIRDRKGLILSMIEHVVKKLTYPGEFLIECEVLLDVFWKELSSTTERATAATVFCLTLIYVEDAPPAFKGICDEFGVELSTVIYQIKYKLVKRHKVEGFTTLRQSLPLLKQFLMRNV